MRDCCSKWLRSYQTWVPDRSQSIRISLLFSHSRAQVLIFFGNAWELEWEGFESGSFGPWYHPLKPLSLRLILDKLLWRWSLFLYVYDLLHHFCSHWEIWESFCCFCSLCFFRFVQSQSATVVLGAHSLSKNEASKKTFRIKDFIPFPRFTSDPESNDIMLVKVCSTALLQFLQHSSIAWISY